jgi:hypothetical protein
MSRVKESNRADWLPEYKEGYEAAEKAITIYGWERSYATYRSAKPGDLFGAGFLSGLCDLDPNKGRARTFRGNNKLDFGIR